MKKNQSWSINLQNLSVRSLIYVCFSGWFFILFSQILTFYFSRSNDCSFFARLNVNSFPLPFALLCIGLIFLSLAVLGFFISQNIDYGEIKKYWLVALAALSIISVPTNTHDISFYFRGGELSESTSKVYSVHWNMKDLFYCPSPDSGTDGIMYGPLTIDLFRGLATVTYNNPVFFIIVWKFLMLFSLVFSIFIAQKVIEEFGVAVNKKWLFLLWLAQPFLLWEGVANGHFDILMELFILLSIWMAMKKRWGLTIALLTVGIWLKFVPLVLGPIFLIWWWNDLTPENWKTLTLRTVLGVLGAILITALAWLPYWSGTEVLKPIILQSKWVVSSLFGVFYFSFKDIFDNLFRSNSHFILTRLIHLLVGVIALYFAFPVIKEALNVIRSQKLDKLIFLRMTFICVLIFTGIWQKSFWPWYITWLLPLGLIIIAIKPNEFVKEICLWLSVVPLSFYLIWGLNHFTRKTDAPGELWFWYFIVLVVWFYPFFQLYKWRKTGYQI